MNAEAKQASMIIESVSRAVANWTVDLHAEENPQLSKRYGDSWRSDWVGHTLAQIQHLAQAVAVRSEDIYANTLRWTLDSFQTRGVDQADLLRNNDCLRNVLSKELPPAVSAMVSPFIELANERAQQMGSNGQSNEPSSKQSDETVLAYLKAILEGNRQNAESVILQLIEKGMSIRDIYDNILAPAQAQMGALWHRGEITIADEHFGSATTQAIMSQLRPHFQRSAPKDRLVVGTSTPGDMHEIGLRMVVDLFEIDGWTAIYLGANTPTEDVIELLQRRTPDLLTLSVSTALTLRDAGTVIEAIRETPGIQNTKILVGGPPFSASENLWKELGADGFAKSAQDAVKLGNALASS